MLISTTTCGLNNFYSDKECIEIIKESGFDAYDFSMFSGHSIDNFLEDSYLLYAKDLRKFADSIGICCNQTHAPCPSFHPDEKTNEKYIKGLIRALEVTSVLGGKYCIVHPWNYYSPEENAEKIFSKLLPYAKKFNVKIAVENMWNFNKDVNGKKAKAACSSPENFKKHLDLLDRDWFVACLDVGHAAIMDDDTTPENMVEALNERLCALHVHDNDLYNDSHIMPFDGKINFPSFLKKLKEINYSGYFTFEVVTFSKDFPKSLVKARYKYMYNVGKSLVDMIE